MNRPLATAASLFRGQALGCHTVAALHAFLPHYETEQALCFEALTGVPFGTTSRAGDPNRLIAPILDPDLGLDRAFTLIGLPLETRWFEPTEGAWALALLTSWLQESPVLLGPLDMGGLSYLPHPELFSGCDHYVVALDLEQQGLWLLDGEGAFPALMPAAEFMNAWSATEIPEGRGAFMMRRGAGRTASVPGADSLLAGVRQAARLTAQAGGASAEVYRALADREAQILACPSERRGLEFLLPVRAQRNLAAMALIEGACAMGVSGTWERCLKAMRDEWLVQCLAVGRCVAGLLAREPGCLQALREFAASEDILTTLFHDLEDQ